MVNKTIIFTDGIIGFHVYRANWNPKEVECLNCFHEEINPCDIFSIGDIPLEISQIMKFLIQRGAVVTVKVTGKHYRRSPLVQGGLEVPCENCVKISGSIVNYTLLQRYETLLRELYSSFDCSL